MLKSKMFNLTELIIVVCVLVILIAIVLPNVSSLKKEAEDTRKIVDLRNVQAVVDIYKLKQLVYPTFYQPYYTYEEIDWNDLYPKYIRKIPVTEVGVKYYVDPHGIVHLNYGTDAYFLSWLKGSDFIVSNPTDAVYDGMNPPVGAVFLNYNKSTSNFENHLHESKISILSTAMTGDSLISAYKWTGEDLFLERAEIIGDFLATKIYQGSFYGTPVYRIVASTDYNGNWVDYTDESYVKDMAISAKFLIDLGILTNNDYYCNEGKKLLDTLCFIQEAVKNAENPIYANIEGALPDILVGNGISWNTFPLDIAYMIYDLSETAYQKYHDSNYLKLKDDYFEFMEKAFTSYGALSANGYPYEYIRFNGTSFNAENYNQDTGIWGENEPFTTDQFFYTILGLVKNGSSRSEEMFNLASQLANRNYQFWGQYNIDGTSASPYIETCNTSFYLLLNKYLNKGLDREIEDLLLKSIEKSNDININHSWTWAPNEPLVESLVSSLAIQSILYRP